MNLSLNGRVALVTGATGDIGSAIASELHSQGATVILTARNLTRLRDLRERLIAKQISTPFPLYFSADLTEPKIEHKIVSYVMTHCGQIDILVNNAAIVTGKLLLRSDPEYTDKTIQTNFIVPYNLMREVVPIMARNKYGRIINITSVVGSMGDAGMSAYAASKGAITAATKSITAEYARRGITANCVAPGIIETRAIAQIPAQRRKTLLQEIPTAKFGKPSDVAAVVAFLASECAGYINGQQIHVNGGYYR